LSLVVIFLPIALSKESMALYKAASVSKVKIPVFHINFQRLIHAFFQLFNADFAYPADSFKSSFGVLLGVELVFLSIFYIINNKYFFIQNTLYVLFFFFFPIF